MKFRYFSLALFAAMACAVSAQKVVDVEFVSPRIARVRYTENGKFTGNNTISVVYRDKVRVDSAATADGKIYKSDCLSVEVGRNNRISFYDKSGKLLFTQEGNIEARPVAVTRTMYDGGSGKVIDTVDGTKMKNDVVATDTLGAGWSYKIPFQWGENDALYGLGCHMEDYMNLRNRHVYLVQHNLKAPVPMLVSTGGYGLMFDSGCGMQFDDSPHGASFLLEAANDVDYYVIYGPEMDDVISGYRHITGKVQWMPKYLFGYIQSKERYKTQDELLSTARRLREEHIPTDVIVQDWRYWSEGWGAKSFDPKRYPSPDSMADELHSLGMKLMVSIWPNITSCPEATDMTQRGFMLGQGVYNAYDSAAADAYWDYADKGLFKYGVDAWWCDCSEPVDSDWGGGDGYGYENSEYSTYTLSWDDSGSRMTIDSRKGSYAGMPAERVFKVSLLGGKTKIVRYKGKKITVKL